MYGCNFYQQISTDKMLAKKGRPYMGLDVAPKNEFQRLDMFELPAGFRGRSAPFVQFWWIVQTLIVKPLPQICYRIRRLLLRAFGAKIGAGVKIRPGVEITYPWKVVIGDNSWIGDGVTLYSLGPISIGSDSVISQNSYICAADHDYSNVSFPIRARPVELGDQVWIASDVWIGPGVKVADGVVVGARSTVTKDLPAGTICVGSPCKPIKRRIMKQNPENLHQSNEFATPTQRPKHPI